jgi:hypothetical protein
VRDPKGGPLGPWDPSLISPAYDRVSSVAPNPTCLRSGIEALRYRVDGYPKRYIVLDPHQVSERSLDPRAGALAPYPPSTQVSCVTLTDG